MSGYHTERVRTASRSRPSKEKEITNGICEILSVTPKQLELLEKRVHAKNGHIRVIVHPFGLEDTIEPVTNVKRSFAHTKRVIAQHGTKRGDVAPTLMLVQTDDSGGVHPNVLRDANNFSQVGIHIIPTESNHSTPSQKVIEASRKLIRALGRLEGDEPDRFLGWAGLVAALKAVGVESATVSGGYIGEAEDASKNEFPNEILISRCLGDLVRNFRLLGLKVDISPSSAYKDGLTRADLSRLGVAAKDTGKNR